MASFEPKVCQCSLRGGVHHLVKTHTEWERHTLQVRLDRLDSLAPSPIADPPPLQPSRVNHISHNQPVEESVDNRSSVPLEPPERYAALEPESPPMDDPSPPHLPDSPTMEPLSPIQQADFDYVSADEHMEESQHYSSSLVSEPKERFAVLLPDSPTMEPLSPIQQAYLNHVAADEHMEETQSYSSPLVSEPKERYAVLVPEFPPMDYHSPPDLHDSPITEPPPLQLAGSDHFSANSTERQSYSSQSGLETKSLPMGQNFLPDVDFR